jgi:hypothetical protein
MYTVDYDNRWSKASQTEFVDTTEGSPYQEWLPGPGGIIYSDHMSVFYETFYASPFADWQYILGFEPALMPEDDLVILTGIHRSGRRWRSYQPWAEKLRPEDRLWLYLPPGSPAPRIPALEWRPLTSRIWSGRKPAPAP